MLDITLIGNRIKELRKERGLTQNAFAEVMHVSFQAVSNWERGIAPPELENIVRIASYFGVLVDDLLRPIAEPLFLGIDGGGTKTEFVVTTQNGHVLRRFICGSSNPNDIGLKNTEELIGDGIRDVLVDFPSVCSAFCGIAGVSTGDNKRQITEYLHQRYPNLKIRVETDSSNLFAMDTSADMAVISGTGSVVFVRQDNKYIRLGGWGYLLDFGGSAYDIGRDALRVTLEEEDSLQKPSVLTELVSKKLETQKIWDAVSKIYAQGKPYIASLADVVFEAYAEKDINAVAIIDRNAQWLAKRLNMGIEQYGARSRAVAGGGIFEHHWDIMTENIYKYTKTELVSVGLPQIYGACCQALSIAGATVTNEFYENFKNTYRSEK